ncbi:uncharacterized protein K460DRAFT_404703 [Cucurbitaria berberidis CBS 394.84]|uniref:F-box domain-containing protein n=1 Tax=Cucurbitaria berberidis CBS 394.84 TaxID=1168544 RepID=A0A9P4GPL7_9PLEO|nr:uncharacterized protein K460DRAFT_404703 [Cucurbitaria berberidis CBS 394.84]KAF1849482.1 hypothetical protein K460DRAFT_404703 [Cucurbitaria berberidis CBS 394.84]
MSALDQLPDELILEIVGHLKPIPAYEARDYLGPCGPRFEGNARRTGQILNICLVSKRFWGLAEPILYSSLLLCTAGWHCYHSLFCLISALLHKPARATHIRYLEQVQRIVWAGKHPRQSQCCHIQGWVADYTVLVQVAKDFWQNGSLDEWIQCLRFEPGYALFALVVALSPNVSHLALDNNHWRVPLLTLLFFDRSACPMNVSFHGFPKLKRLCSFADMDRRQHDPVYGSSQSLRWDLPALRHYQHQGAWARGLVPFRNLATLRLEDCLLSIQKVALVVHDCPSLQIFVCVWFEEPSAWERHWSSLLSALGDTSSTLQQLDLRFGRGDEAYPDDLDFIDLDGHDFLEVESRRTIPQPDGYTDLSKLTSLSLMDVMLFGEPAGTQAPNARPKRPISCLLPSNLERLTVETNHILLQDDSLALHDLADDLYLLPALKIVEIQAATHKVPFVTSMEKTMDLTARFKERGVALILLHPVE